MSKKVRNTARVQAPKKTLSKRPSRHGKTRSQASLAEAGVELIVRKGTAGKPAARKAMVKKAAAKKVGTRTVAAKKVVARKAAQTGAIAKNVVSHILSAPQGTRSLTHRKIKQAVERIFEERYGTDA